MVGRSKDKPVPERKLVYAKKLRSLLQEFDSCLIVSVTNVGSKQIADMRKEFRKKGRFLFGKNTLIKKIIRDYIKETGEVQLKSLLDICTGNTGFFFTKEDVGEMRKLIIGKTVQRQAKPGTLAPLDVFIPPGPTGMEPTQTSFFQAMNIETRINRGQIDILDKVHLIKKGIKVGVSEALLLFKLGIKPFYYGPKVVSIYKNGEAFDASVLDITSDDIANGFSNGLKKISSFCFTLKMPTVLNVPHITMNTYKRVLALGLKMEGYSWEGLETIKTALANPGAGAAAAAPAAGGKAAPTEEKKVEKEESAKSSSKGAVNMFGGDDSDSDDSSGSD